LVEIGREDQENHKDFVTFVNFVAFVSEREPSTVAARYASA
jgi:hypothetical protein